MTGTAPQFVAQQITLSSQELAQGLENLATELRSGVISLNITEDFYWSFLNSEEVFDVSNEPSEFGIGSLSEDIHFLKKTIEVDVSPGLYTLSKLFPILSYLYYKDYGEKI